jgi:hypothetical protein
MRTVHVRGPLAAACCALLAVACGSDDGDDDGDAGDRSVATAAASSAPRSTAAAATSPEEQRFPEVIDATAELRSTGWTFSATISSPYDTPERYADAWRVVGPDGEVFGVRELTHDHASEQPFTRSLSGIDIPETVDRVTIEGRDLANGWGGATAEVALTPR